MDKIPSGVPPSLKNLPPAAAHLVSASRARPVLGSGAIRLAYYHLELQVTMVHYISTSYIVASILFFNFIRRSSISTQRI